MTDRSTAIISRWLGAARAARALRAATVALAVSFGLGAGACTHTKSVLATPQAFVGERVTLHLHDGDTEDAQATSTVHGAVWYTDSGQEVAHERVRMVERVRVGRGALEGMAAGAVLAVATGTALGAASGDDPRGVPFAFTAGEKAVILSVVLTPVGALVGVLAGAIRGSRDQYLTASGAGGVVPSVSAQPVPGGGTATLSWSF